MSELFCTTPLYECLIERIRSGYYNTLFATKMYPKKLAREPAAGNEATHNILCLFIRIYYISWELQTQ